MWNNQKIRNEIIDNVNCLNEYRAYILSVMDDDDLSFCPDMTDYSLDISSFFSMIDDLDGTTDSVLFKKIREVMSIVPIKYQDHLFYGASTEFVLTKKDRLRGVSSVKLPLYYRKSVDFTCLHESIHVLYYAVREKRRYTNVSNIEVAPYFTMLYALDRLSLKYGDDTIKFVRQMFISNVVNSIEKLNQQLLKLYEVESKMNEKIFITDSVYQEYEKAIYVLFLHYKQAIGPIEAISLYNKLTNRDVIRFFNKIGVNTNIGREFDYKIVSFEKNSVYNNYKNFIKEYEDDYLKRR